jgi:hypothetical protein
VQNKQYGNTSGGSHSYKTYKDNVPHVSFAKDQRKLLINMEPFQNMKRKQNYGKAMY